MSKNRSLLKRQFGGQIETSLFRLVAVDLSDVRISQPAYGLSHRGRIKLTNMVE